MFSVVESSRDGLCMLYSTRSSYLYQTGTEPCSLSDLISKLCDEVLLNSDRYLVNFENSYSRLNSEIDAYFKMKQYNNSFCDIVPFLISSVLKCKFVIVHTDSLVNGCYRTTSIAPITVDSNCQCIHVVKNGNHYDGLKSL